MNQILSNSTRCHITVLSLIVLYSRISNLINHARFGVLNGLPPECFWLDDATDYMGRINITESGITCQRWDQQVPHSHPLTEGHYFPDRDVTLAENYCRNTENIPRIWCYTTNPDVRWATCAVPRCDRTSKEYLRVGVR